MEIDGRPQGLKMVPNEIVLQIVEYMDTLTLQRFMVSNKGLYAVITSHERSICLNRAAAFTLPPSGNVLSSSTGKRRVLPANTFSMIYELELRNDRIDSLIKEIFDMRSPPWLPSIGKPLQSHLHPILKRALHQCDRIADIAANESCPGILPEYYHTILDKIHASPPASSTTAEESAEINPLTNIGARPYQIEYIRSLSLQDIAGIFILINMIGHGLNTCQNCHCPLSQERKTVLEECVLRHGTWFVWSCYIDSMSMRAITTHLLSTGIAELRRWEAGSLSGPPGLRMTLVRRFNQLLGGGSGQGGHSKIHETVERLVFGEEIACMGQEPDPTEEE